MFTRAADAVGVADVQESQNIRHSENTPKPAASRSSQLSEHNASEDFDGLTGAAGGAGVAEAAGDVLGVGRKSGTAPTQSLDGVLKVPQVPHCRDVAAVSRL